MRVKKKSLIVDHMSLSNGQVLDSTKAVHDEAVQFFQELLSTSDVNLDEEALSL